MLELSKITADKYPTEKNHQSPQLTSDDFLGYTILLLVLVIYVLFSNSSQNNTIMVYIIISVVIDFRLDIHSGMNFIT